MRFPTAFASIETSQGDRIDDEMTAPTCPLCRGTRLAGASFRLLRCEGCDLIVDPSLWRERDNETLQHDWFGEEYDPEQSAWVRTFQRWNDGRTMRRLASADIGGNKLLEIGVGTGSFLRRARAAGFEVAGCDLSTSLCRRMERRHGIRMHCGHARDIPGRGVFHVVVMNHVLEHVADPIGLLLEVRRLLAPGGVLHLAVPNVACFEARLPGWGSYEPYHLVYFSPATLRHAVEAAGFVIERELTHESFSGWFLAAVRTLLGTRRSGEGAGARLAARHARNRSAVEHLYRLAMIIAGGLTWPLRSLQAVAGKGDEAVCVARCPGD